MAQQEGLERYRLGEKYFDIMLVGMTGQGKSTTADKLLIANPTGIKYEPLDDSRPETSVEGTQLQGAQPGADQVRVALTDISTWLLHEDDKQEVDTHLKGLVYCRTSAEPHKKVNDMRDPKNKIFTGTNNCQVFSNDTTKIRIMDVPGFHDARAFKSPLTSPTSPTGAAKNVESSDIYQSAKEVTSFHIGITRNIIRIQSALGMYFRRIVYFLPNRGPLERPHSVLKIELQALEHAFGRSIFQSMVVVATLSRRPSLKDESDEEKFPQEDIQQCDEFFQIALREVLGAGPNDAIPKVPIIFISLAESCESILNKVKTAPVICDDGLKLNFNPTTCANCGLKIGSINGERVTCAFRDQPNDSFPYCESTCHPAFKRSWIRIVLGQRISRKISQRWPSYKEEFCINCKSRPFELGCMQVKKKYKLWWGGVYVVDHTNIITEPVDAEELAAAEAQGTVQEPEGDPGPQENGHQTGQQNGRGDQLVGGVAGLRLAGSEGGRPDVLVQASPPIEERKGT